MKKKIIKVELTMEEFSDLIYHFALADSLEYEFLNVKDGKIRKQFKKHFERRHKLWIKLTHIHDKNL